MVEKDSFVISALQEKAAHQPLPDSKCDPTVPERAQWNNKIEFVLSCISLSVGLGNVWRFPYVAYANGGGAFLLPYLIVLLLCGKPMYFMECAFGQFHQEGPVTIWKRVSPIAKGIGVAQMLIQIMVAMYYDFGLLYINLTRHHAFWVFVPVIIMAWTMYYFWTTLIAACQSENVPWDSHFCDSEWAHKATCLGLRPPPENESQEIPVVAFDNLTFEDTRESSGQQYYDRVILMRYDKGSTTRYDLGSMGGVNWILLANLAASWVIVFFALVKGISSAGKAVYITSTLPFIVLFILVVRGTTLTNAVEGINYFVIPQFDKLLDVQTWRNAAEQMFYSLSVAFGSLVMLGSYNKRSNNCYQDAMIVSVADTATSMIAGIAMFSVLGFMAGRLDIGVDKVAVSGPGLAFVTFPEALNQMPLPHLWSILFFIMLFTLGLGSEIATLETVLTIVYDHWPVLRNKKPLVCGLACLGCFLAGLPFVLQGGVDLFLIFDSYAGGFSVLFPAVVELAIVMWVYGLSRFVNDLHNMLGKRVGIYWRATWGFLAPLTLLFILIITFADYTPLNHGGDLPDFADSVGWGLATISIIQIPIWAVVEVYRSKGTTFMQKLRESCWPAEIMVPKPRDFMELTDVEKLHISHVENGSIELDKKEGFINGGFNACNEDTRN